VKYSRQRAAGSGQQKEQKKNPGGKYIKRLLFFWLLAPDSWLLEP
jgi:hypothetical protein